jgi:hypothetical protein
MGFQQTPSLFAQVALIGLDRRDLGVHALLLLPVSPAACFRIMAAVYGLPVDKSGRNRGNPARPKLTRPTCGKFARVTVLALDTAMNVRQLIVGHY